MSDRPSLRERLRALPTLTGTAPDVDPAAVPADPVDLFVAWLEAAVVAGVPEPHAVTIATADPDGRPSSRVVVLKDVRDGGWEFATDARSRKARDLARNPQAAASFYWPLQARQVRLTGTVTVLGPQACAADFLARSPGSRAAALAARPGEPLSGPEELTRATAAALRRVEVEPDTVLGEWVVYALRPDEVEFWQGDPGRAHTRVVYRRVGGAWTHQLVWP